MAQMQEQADALCFWAWHCDMLDSYIWILAICRIWRYSYDFSLSPSPLFFFFSFFSFFNILVEHIIAEPCLPGVSLVLDWNEHFWALFGKFYWESDNNYKKKKQTQNLFQSYVERNGLWITAVLIWGVYLNFRLSRIWKGVWRLCWNKGHLSA